MFQAKCTACEFPIEPGDQYLEAMGGTLHVECFNCSVGAHLSFSCDGHCPRFSIMIEVSGESERSTICYQDGSALLPSTRPLIHLDFMRRWSEHSDYPLSDMTDTLFFAQIICHNKLLYTNATCSIDVFACQTWSASGRRRDRSLNSITREVDLIGHSN